MDVFTQGVIGAVSAQSIAKKEHIRYASIIGFLSGLLADVDFFFRSNSDPLLTLDYHRHFTHSLFFIPIGALIASLILWPFFRNKLSNKALYLYCLAGFLFSGFIDTCTSYGTYLLWPLINERIAWHIIAIVDPVFIGVLLISFVIAFKSKTNIYSRTGLVLAGCYLLLNLVQLNRAETFIQHIAEERGHTTQKLIVKPTLGNNILWRTIYLHEEEFYVDAVRVGLDKKLYPGSAVQRFRKEKSLPELNDGTTLAKDIKRFEIFSDGYVSHYPGKMEILGDVRYAMTPISVIPLWGIEMDITDPARHVKYQFYRNTSQETRQQFMDMLFNR